MLPDYPPISACVATEAAWSILLKKKRSFRQDALRLTRNLSIKNTDSVNIPCQGPGVILVNHYQRPGFFTGWIALALSAAVPEEVIWTMTAAWTGSSTRWERIKSATSAKLFPRLAHMYGFIPMPPMPPRPQDLEARTGAVRQVLSVARRRPPVLLAIAPEGQDSPNGGLMRPHPGVGRMLSKLAESGCRFHPVGVYEDGQALVLNFGTVFSMPLQPGLSNREIDQLTADTAMQAVADRLPEHLRGIYAGESLISAPGGRA